MPERVTVNVERATVRVQDGPTVEVRLGTLPGGDPAGTAATLLAAHEAEADPHPQYPTVPVAIAEGGTGATDAATARSNLGLAIGTDVAAQRASLICGFVNYDSQWTNMPAATTEWAGLIYRRAAVDLTGYTQVCVVRTLTVPGSAGSVWGVQYSLDLVTWKWLDDGSTDADMGSHGPQVDISTAGPLAGSWTTLVAEARGPVYLRPMGAGGNGVTDPRGFRFELHAR